MGGGCSTQNDPLIIEVDAQGGINTLSLHPANPVTGGNAWHKRPAVGKILPGGTHHASFLKVPNSDWLVQVSP